MDAKLKTVVLEFIDAGRNLSLATLRGYGHPQADTLAYGNDGLILFSGTARH